MSLSDGRVVELLDQYLLDDGLCLDVCKDINCVFHLLPLS